MVVDCCTSAIDKLRCDPCVDWPLRPPETYDILLRRDESGSSPAV